MELREHQPAIEKYFIEHKTLEGAISAVDLSKMHYEADAIFLTSPNGAIAAIDKNISISILLWPEISNETLVWHCSVSPKNVSPVFCNGGANVLPNKAD